MTYGACTSASSFFWPSVLRTFVLVYSIDTFLVDSTARVEWINSKNAMLNFVTVQAGIEHKYCTYVDICTYVSTYIILDFSCFFLNFIEIERITAYSKCHQKIQMIKKREKKKEKKVDSKNALFN